MHKRNWLTIGIVFLAIQAVWVRYLRQSDVQSVDIGVEKNSRIHPLFFKAMSLSFLPAAIDWKWISVLRDDRVQHVPEGQRAGIFYDLELLTLLDERNYNFYYIGSMLLSVIRDDNRGAEIVLSRGEHFRERFLPKYSSSFKEKYWRDDWRVPFTLGFIHMYELEDITRGSLFYQKASKINGSPKYLSSLYEKISTVPGRYVLGLTMLNSLIQTAVDEETVEKLKVKQFYLGLGQYLYSVNEQFLEFLSEKKLKLDNLSFEQVSSHWKRFQTTTGIRKDPVGGRLFVSKDYRIETTTEREVVMGMPF